MDNEVQKGETPDAILVGKNDLSAAVETSIRLRPGEGFTFVATEPLLSAYFRVELLQTLGKLAVSGASTRVVRGVGADVHRLITVVAMAMKLGYGSLLEDFLPEFSEMASGSHANSADDAEPSK